MIKRVSDLLQKIIATENRSLKDYNLTHGPTIGDMYEGFTKKWIDKALPIHTPLFVSAGFIEDDSGKMSGELDCMVVTSEGEDVPHTDKKKFKVDDVVAVLQIKKKLYAKGIADGYQNLRTVLQFTPAKLKRTVLFKDAFQSVTRRPLPRREDVEKLPYEIQMLYHSFLTDFASPATIILGYDGFKSHSKFRQSFVDYLSANSGDEPKQGFGPTSFPDLIVSGKWSLVKGNGMPFISPLENDNFWPVYNSSASNPIELILQIIWTRLVYDKKMDPSVFDDDIWLESSARFISTKCIKKDDGRQGWIYKFIDACDKDLENDQPQKRWEPIFLDYAQYVVVNRLCANDIDLKDPDLKEFLTKEGYTTESLVESLRENGLAGRSGDTLELLTRGCVCVILPDGRYVAGENISGQLTRWVNDFIESRNVQP